MAYTLQALIGRQDDLEAFASHLPHAPLPHGLALVPLTANVRKALGVPFLPLADEGESVLPPSIIGLCELLAEWGPVAYVEAELFGGPGIQAHVLFRGGAALGPVVVSECAINEALRFLGVQRKPGQDEFDSVGLGQQRETESWIV